MGPAEKSSNQAHGSLAMVGSTFLPRSSLFDFKLQCSLPVRPIASTRPIRLKQPDKAFLRPYSDLTVQLASMSRSPLDQLQAMARRARMSGGGGGAPNPRNAAGIAAIAALGIGGTMLLQNSLFNVDGGHRAIKYRRISGVSKEIYSEGLSRLRRPLLDWIQLAHNVYYCRNASENPLVRDIDRLRCARKAEKCVFTHRHQGFADGEHHLPCAV